MFTDVLNILQNIRDFENNSVNMIIFHHISNYSEHNSRGLERIIQHFLKLCVEGDRLEVIAGSVSARVTIGESSSRAPPDTSPAHLVHLQKFAETVPKPLIFRPPFLKCWGSES